MRKENLHDVIVDHNKKFTSVFFFNDANRSPFLTHIHIENGGKGRRNSTIFTLDVKKEKKRKKSCGGFFGLWGGARKHVQL